MKLVTSPRQAKVQLVRALRNLDPQSTGGLPKEKLKWALGPDYLNLQLTPEEIEHAVELCPSNELSGMISYDKFVRVLNIRNNDPIADPFFDTRANQITKLRRRGAELDARSEDPDLCNRRDELMKICMVGPGPDGVARYLDPYRTCPHAPRPTIHPDDETLPRNIALVQSYKNMTNLRNEDVRDKSPVCPAPPSPTKSNNGPSSPLTKRVVSAHSRLEQSSTSTNTFGGGDSRTRYQGITRAVSIDTTTQDPPPIDSGTIKRGIMGDASRDVDVFRAVRNASSHTYVKYPMTVDVKRAHEHHKESIPRGRKYLEQPTSDWGIWRSDSSSLCSDVLPPIVLGLHSTSSRDSLSTAPSTSNLTSPVDSKYRSTYSQYYAPLDYQSSQPVSRPGVLGDAVICAQQREVIVLYSMSTDAVFSIALCSFS